MIDYSVSPGSSYTFRTGSNTTMVYPLQGATLFVRDVAERMLWIEANGRTPKRVFVNRLDFLTSYRWESKGRTISTISRAYRRGWKWYVFGVPVVWTRGKEKFYVVDDKGNRY